MNKESMESLLELGTKISRGQREPNRVIVDASGRALSVKHARAQQYDVKWQVCFIRDDGWSLAAPQELREVAWSQWPESWSVVVERGGIPHPILNGRCPVGCGACCTYLIVEPEEIDAIREPKILDAVNWTDEKYKLPILGADGMEFIKEWSGQPILCPRIVDRKMAGCALLNGVKLCTIYATRPGCCVAMPVGGSACRRARETMFADAASKAARK